MSSEIQKKLTYEFYNGELNNCFKMLIQLNSSLGLVKLSNNVLNKTQETKKEQTVASDLEKIIVKHKDGRKTVKVIDHQKNVQSERKIKQFFEKTKCTDIFQDQKVGNKQSIAKHTPRQII